VYSAHRSFSKKQDLQLFRSHLAAFKERTLAQIKHNYDDYSKVFELGDYLLATSVNKDMLLIESKKSLITNKLEMLGKDIDVIESNFQHESLAS